ncbi:hypothetical protein B0H14DRAFT_3471765 [Mycena olivaceomarginata]|nr:hypothetical protein B0H14DRAFT_3471765 [Mycena olivaceomarginata]
MAPRGNKGYFHSEPLSFLNDSLPHYLSIAPTKKEIFWSKFFPEWDTKLHKAESERVKAANQEETKRRGRRKAVLEAYPATSVQLNELRARAADDTKLKGWFSNAKTKEKTRKIEPFHHLARKPHRSVGSPSPYADALDVVAAPGPRRGAVCPLPG